MNEYTSLEVSKRLAELGFTGDEGIGMHYLYEKIDSGYRSIWSPRADTLEQWLFTKGSEMIVGAQAGGGFNVNWGINLFVGTGKNLPDAYADVVIQYLEWWKENHVGVKP